MEADNLSSANIEETNCVGQWWRASAYEVTFGHIQPTPDAIISPFDPWKEYREADAARTKGGGILNRPYLSLVELVKSFDPTESHGWAHIDPDKWPIITQWCAEHGLMGLFFTEARQVNLYPRWVHLNVSNSIPSPLPYFSSHLRTPTGWLRRSTGTFNIDAMSLSDDQRIVGALVPKEYWIPEWEPGVITADEKGFIKRVPMATFMGQYFSSVPVSEREIWEYPTPLTADFWKNYSEKVTQFVVMAREFVDMVRAIARFNPESELSEVEQYEITTARQRLLYLSSQVNPSLGINKDGSYVREWVCTSQLASFAMMVMLDAERGLINECANCKTIFVSSAGRAKFCSDRCRRTALQRERRGRKRGGYSPIKTGSYEGGGYTKRGF
jgi:hypothetical protein